MQNVIQRGRIFYVSLETRQSWQKSKHLFLDIREIVASIWMIIFDLKGKFLS